MQKWILCLALSLSGHFSVAALGPPLASAKQELQNHLQGNYPGWATDLDWNALGGFYRGRMNHPAWLAPTGLRKEAGVLLRALSQSRRHGLNPHEYHIEAIRYLWRSHKPRSRARLELLLSDAFFRYSVEIRAGYQYPRIADPEWYLSPGKVDPLALLEDALRNNNLAELLESLPPAHEPYQNLKWALQRYQKVASEHGDWPQLADGPLLSAGNRDPDILLLRRRLRIEGFLSRQASIDSARMDADMIEAVRDFQHHYGLKTDGIVGPATRRALNVPLATRISQLQQNMERWRWLPDDLGQRYVMVNMAGYRLYLIENEKISLDMRVIIGKPYKATPAFSDEIEYLVINPDWIIPSRIAKEEYLPELKQDNTYLNNRHIQLYESWKKNAAELDPRKIDWHEINPENFPFKLIQSPGNHNSLGRIKFMFPNSWRIYLHDTPQKRLFQRSVRTFSAGCIRLEDPVKLASKLLQGSGQWSPAWLKQQIQSQQTLRIDLPQAVPIYLLYWTAWADENGRAHFRDDIYQRNRYITTAPLVSSPAAADNT